MAALSADQRRAVSRVLGWIGEGQRTDRCPGDLRGPLRMCIRMGIVTEESWPNGVKVCYRTAALPPDLDGTGEDLAELTRTAKAGRCRACGAPVIAARNNATGKWHNLTPTPVPGGTLDLWLPEGGVPSYRIVHNFPKGLDPDHPTYHAHHSTVCRQATLFDGS